MEVVVLYVFFILLGPNTPSEMYGFSTHERCVETQTSKEAEADRQPFRPRSGFPHISTCRAMQVPLTTLKAP